MLAPRANAAAAAPPAAAAARAAALHSSGHHARHALQSFRSCRARGPRLAAAAPSRESSSAAAPSWQQRQPRQRRRPPQQQLLQQQQEQQQEQLAPPPEQQRQAVRVAVSSSVQGVAQALLAQLREHGAAEVWATSAANHFTAIAALAEAQRQLLVRHRRQPPQPGRSGQLAGLAATAALAPQDQAVHDDQKRGLRKLVLSIVPAPPLPEALLAPGGLSTNRTTGAAAVQEQLQAQLQPGAGAAAVEARGEQAVTRALKAVLALQAAGERRLRLRPCAAKVVDVVAEKRGQPGLLSDGLRLVVEWEGGDDAQ